MIPLSPAIVDRLRRAGCVFAEDETAILQASAGSPDELESMVARRVGGLPLEQVVGWAEFCGLRIGVDPGVFVPRRRSEFLVEVAAGLAGFRASGPPVAPPGTGAPQHAGPPPVIVDLCCGTGALGLALATRLAGGHGAGAGPPAGIGAVELHAAELDPAAVACARKNVEPAGGHVHEGDLFTPLPAGLKGRVGILICNAPYVPTREIAFMPPEARDHEARMALDGGSDGLAIVRRAVEQAPGWLAPGGSLLVEASERQAPSVAAALAGAGLRGQVHSEDEMGATVVSGTREASRGIGLAR